MPVFLVVENGRKRRVSIKERAHSASGVTDGECWRAILCLARFDRECAAAVVHCFERIEHEVFNHFFDSDRVSECIQTRRQSRDDRMFAARWLGRHGEHSLNDRYEIDFDGRLCSPLRLVKGRESRATRAFSLSVALVSPFKASERN